MFPPGTAIVRYHLRLTRPSWSCSERRWSGETKFVNNQIGKLVNGDWLLLAIGNVRVKKTVDTLLWSLRQILQYGKRCDPDGQVVQKGQQQGENEN